MIKFFRKIRQNLLTENKFSKYLLYAIGEIVLVVIGILIALSINNSNENRKNENLGASYLLEMIKEVQTDVNSVDFQLNRLEQNLINQEAALNTKNIKTLSLDSLNMILEGINTDFSIKQITFNKMNNLGLTGLSNNDKLNQQITNYYNRHAPYMTSIIGFNTEYLKKDHDFFRYDQNKIDIISDFSNVEFPSLYKEELKTERMLQQKNTLEFVQSIQGRNLILVGLRFKRRLKTRLIAFQWEAANLLKSIYDELDLTGIQLSDAELKKYVGRYEHSKGVIFQITLENSKLYGTLNENEEQKGQLIPFNEKMFFSLKGNIKVKFTIDNDVVLSLSTKLGNEEVTAKKTE